MKSGKLLFAGIFLASLVMPNAVLAQLDSQVDKAVSQARHIFETKGFDPEVFPSGRFSAQYYDAMIFHLAWSAIMTELQEMLRSTLQLGEPISLYPFLVRDWGAEGDCAAALRVRVTRRNCPVRCVFRITGRRIIYPSVETRDVRFVFSKQPDSVRQVLKRLLPITDDDFLDLVIVSEFMSKLTSRDFLPRYRDVHGKVALGEVERAILALIQNDNGPVKDLELSPTVAEREKGLRITTSWKLAGRQPESRQGRYYWRLNIGFEKLELDQDIWRLTVAVNLGYRPLSESDPRKTKWLGDAASYGNSTLFTVGETRENLPRNQVQQKSGGSPVSIVNPVEQSTLVLINRVVLEKCQIKLCGKLIN